MTPFLAVLVYFIELSKTHMFSSIQLLPSPLSLITLLPSSFCPIFEPLPISGANTNGKHSVILQPSSGLNYSSLIVFQNQMVFSVLLVCFYINYCSPGRSDLFLFCSSETNLLDRRASLSHYSFPGNHLSAFASENQKNGLNHCIISCIVRLVHRHRRQK